MKTREPERQAVARCRDAWIHWRAERRACIARGQAEEAAIAEALEVQAKRAYNAAITRLCGWTA